MELKDGYKKIEGKCFPNTWIETTIGEVAMIQGGGTPDSNNKKYWNGSIDWFTPTEIGDKKYVYHSFRKITEKGLKDSSATLLPINTVLLTSRAGIGDASILKNEACTNQGCQSLISKESINHEYLYYLILSLKRVLEQNASGSTFLELSPRNLSKIQIPLPPLPEQQAIAEVLSDTDNLIQALEKQIAKKRLIKQGAMQKLLTPQEGWKKQKLGDVTELITKGTTPTSIGKEFQNSGINFIKVESLNEDGKFLKDSFAFIDDATYAALKRSQLKKNDLLISIAGALGRTGIVKSNILPANTNQALAIVRLKKEANLYLKYVYYYLRTSQMRKHFMEISVQGAQPNLSLQNISDIIIPYPTNRIEQIEIVDLLSTMDKEIESLKVQLLKYKELKQGLMQNLLTGKIRLA